MSNIKTAENEIALNNYAEAVGAAIEQATESGFLAAVRNTMLADVMQIQCIHADNTELLNFAIPEGLYTTVVDLAKFNGARVTLYESKQVDEFILEFSDAEEQDKFIQCFEMLSYQGQRAFPPPNLYQGAETADEYTCANAIGFLHFALKKTDELGWREIR